MSHVTLSSLSTMSDREANDSSSDEETPDEDPSQDIAEDLEGVLDGELAESFKGSFSHSQTSRDAPNPGLFIASNNVGGVGLPLSKRDAQAIINGSKQAPFGKGERTVVDTTVRDTWEIDGGEVCKGYLRLHDLNCK